MTTLGIGILVGIAFVALAVRTGVSFRRLVFSAIIGTAIGASLDFLLGYHAGLWYYTHHPYWQADYFYLIYPAWATCGVTVVAVHGFLSRYLPLAWSWTIFITATANELLGMTRDAWRYESPFWLIAVGWCLYVVTLNILVEKVDAGLCVLQRQGRHRLPSTQRDGTRQVPVPDEKVGRQRGAAVRAETER